MLGQQGALAFDLARNPALEDYHWAKESPFSSHSSFIVQKGSPLLVRIKSIYFFSTCHQSNFRGHLKIP